MECVIALLGVNTAFQESDRHGECIFKWCKEVIKDSYGNRIPHESPSDYQFWNLDTCQQIRFVWKVGWKYGISTCDKG